MVGGSGGKGVRARRGGGPGGGPKGWGGGPKGWGGDSEGWGPEGWGTEKCVLFAWNFGGV